MEKTTLLITLFVLAVSGSSYVTSELRTDSVNYFCSAFADRTELVDEEAQKEN